MVLVIIPVVISSDTTHRIGMSTFAALTPMEIIGLIGIALSTTSPKIRSKLL
jgi:hypothetical protein